MNRIPVAREAAQECILKMTMVKYQVKRDMLHPMAGMCLLAQEVARGSFRVKNILTHRDPPPGGTVVHPVRWESTQVPPDEVLELLGKHLEQHGGQISTVTIRGSRKWTPWRWFCNLFRI